MDNSGVAGIYLAAGKSNRMGRHKLNLPIAKHYLGSLGLQAALESKLDATIAVTRQGDSLHWLAPFFKKKKVRIVVCEDADKGQSASLKAGVRAAEELGVSGVVVLLADQPFVSCQMINRLVEEACFFRDEVKISYLHRGIPKPPVYFSSSLFPAIRKLTGDQGARNLLRGSGSTSGKHIESANDRLFFDVDTIEDYQSLLDNLDG